MFVVLLEGAALIAMMIVAEVGMVEVVTMILTTATVGPLATMTASVVPTEDLVVTTMAAALIAMLLRVARIAIAVAETIVVVVEMNIMVGTVVVVAVTIIPPVTANRPLQGMLGNHMEVEPMTTVLMIGTPVDRLRSADLFRCGALC